MRERRGQMRRCTDRGTGQAARWGPRPGGTDAFNTAGEGAIKKAKNRPAEFVVQQGGFACPFWIILLRVPGGHK